VVTMQLFRALEVGQQALLHSACCVASVCRESEISVTSPKRVISLPTLLSKEDCQDAAQQGVDVAQLPLGALKPTPSGCFGDLDGSTTCGSPDSRRSFESTDEGAEVVGVNGQGPFQAPDRVADQQPHRVTDSRYSGLLAEVCEQIQGAVAGFDDERPHSQRLLPGLTLESVKAELMRTEGGTMERFLVEHLQCPHTELTEWAEDGPKQWSCGTEGVFAVQSSEATIPLPKDLPAVAVRALKLPEFSQCTSVNRLGQLGETLVLTQTNAARGVLFSDRFLVQNTHTFKADDAGAVEWRQWTRIIWIKPLPWAFSFVVPIFENRMRAEALRGAAVFAEMLVAACVH